MGTTGVHSGVEEDEEGEEEQGKHHNEEKEEDALQKAVGGTRESPKELMGLGPGRRD